MIRRALVTLALAGCWFGLSCFSPLLVAAAPITTVTDLTNLTFQWLVGASSLCVLIGSALLLWGLKVVPVSNPFNSLVRDVPEKAERRLSPVERDHPWAATSGTVLFVIGLTLLVLAGVARR